MMTKKLQRHAASPAGMLEAVTCRKAAARLDPQLTALVPDNFLESHSKTPCWSAAGKTRCLPGFLLAGGFQSGAGTLTAKLAAHPDVITVR